MATTPPNQNLYKSPEETEGLRPLKVVLLLLFGVVCYIIVHVTLVVLFRDEEPNEEWPPERHVWQVWSAEAAPGVQGTSGIQVSRVDIDGRPYLIFYSYHGLHIEPLPQESTHESPTLPSVP